MIHFDSLIYLMTSQVSLVNLWIGNSFYVSCSVVASVCSAFIFMFNKGCGLCYTIIERHQHRQPKSNSSSFQSNFTFHYNRINLMARSGMLLLSSQICFQFNILTMLVKQTIKQSFLIWEILFILHFSLLYCNVLAEFYGTITFLI